ncbi:caspase, EACC1-associated type [Streptomyces sp. NPDC002623]
MGNVRSRNQALLIGSAKYTYNKSQLPDLPAATNDVTLLHEVLSEPPHGVFECVTEVHSPTSNKLLRTVHGFISKLHRSDLGLLYYSGHGKADTFGRLYLATKDSRVNSLASTSLPWTTLKEILVECASRKVILILDCCHSGKAPSGLAKGDSTDFEQLTSEGIGEYVLTSSGAYERSWVSGDRSIFTRFLVEGIESEEADLNGDGFIDVEELYEFARIRTTELKTYQTPTLSKYGAQGSPPVLARSTRRRDFAVPDIRPAMIRSSRFSKEGSNSYYYETIHLQSAWALTPKDSSCDVALLAGAIDKGHPSLQHADIREVEFTQVTDSPGQDETNIEMEFTTAVASILVGRQHEDAFVGVSPYATLHLYRVLAGRATSDFQLLSAISHALDHGLRLICLPIFGRVEGSQIWLDVFARAEQLGALVVCPAGNDGKSEPISFGSIGHSVSVAAVDHEDRIPSYSNYGEWVSVSAPGAGVFSAGPEGSYRVLSGTSLPCCIVTGILALAWMVYPEATPEKLAKALMMSAEDIAHKNPHLASKLVPRRVNAAEMMLATQNLKDSSFIAQTPDI